MNKVNGTIVGTMVFVVLSVFSSMSVQAGFLDKVGQTLGQATGKTSTSGTKSDDILGAFIVSAASINQAQILQAQAFGLKERAQELQIVGKALSSGDVNNKDQIKKLTETSKRANEAIQEKIQSGARLTTEGRSYYLKSLLPFTVGLVGLKHVVENAANIENELKSKNWKKMLSGAATTVYLATKAPGYFYQLYETSSMLVTYSNNNKLNVPADAEAKLGELGSL